jgi:vacuolar-type H+-ATPase subunit I/STV1
MSKRSNEYNKHINDKNIIIEHLRKGLVETDNELEVQKKLQRRRMRNQDDVNKDIQPNISMTDNNNEVSKLLSKRPEMTKIVQQSPESVTPIAKRHASAERIRNANNEESKMMDSKTNVRKVSALSSSISSPTQMKSSSQLYRAAANVKSSTVNRDISFDNTASSKIMEAIHVDESSKRNASNVHAVARVRTAYSTIPQWKPENQSNESSYMRSTSAAPSNRYSSRTELSKSGGIDLATSRRVNSPSSVRPSSYDRTK